TPFPYTTLFRSSGSGKTRFWIKPNLLQMHSSYVLTDPKGTTVLEVGNAFVQKGYRIKIFNTINFGKSMHYNPFHYIHSEKDILKLVTTLMTNTRDRKSTRLNSSHVSISYAVFCLKKE